MKDNIEVENLLKKHGLKKTVIRTEILSLFMKHSFALSASDIESKMKAGHDRVTIYRALNSFVDNGILHKVPDESNNTKFALCSDTCPDEAHTDQHVHFICHECHQTYCLEDVHIPMIKLPNNFAVDSFSFTVNGICETCKDN